MAGNPTLLRFVFVLGLQSLFSNCYAHKALSLSLFENNFHSTLVTNKISHINSKKLMRMTNNLMKTTQRTTIVRQMYEEEQKCANISK